MSAIDNEANEVPDQRIAPPRPQSFGAGARYRRRLRRGAVFRPVETQSRLVAGRPEKATGPGSHDGRERPVRGERHGRASRRDDGDQGNQRQRRRARASDRGDPHGLGDDARHRLTRRRTSHHPQRSRVPDRRAPLGRGQCDLAGRAEVRLHLPQHQFKLADRGGQGLPPRQVRLGWQRHQLRAGHRQERDGGQWQELGAAHERLRMGAPDVEGDADHRRGERRQDHRGAARAAEHARLLVVSPQDPADQAERGRCGHRRRRHQGAAAAGGAGQAQQEPGVDQQSAGLAGRLRSGARRDLRRVRHQLVLPARSAGRQGIRRRVPDHLSRRADPRTGQHVLQRLHGHARALARRGASRHDEQHQGHQGARGAQGQCSRPDAGLRRLHEPGRRTSCSRRSTWRRTTTLRRRRTTSSRSSPSCRRRTSRIPRRPRPASSNPTKRHRRYEM